MNMKILKTLETLVNSKKLQKKQLKILGMDKIKIIIRKLNRFI